MKVVCIIVSVTVACAFSVINAKNFKRKRHTEDAPKSGYVADETDSSYWEASAQLTLEQKLLTQLNVRKARNVILFLGDGMSIPTITAARAYRNEQCNAKKLSEESPLFFETFPYTALSKTYCLDAPVADSACTSTAYLTGVKGNDGTIGVNGKVARGNCTAMRQRENHVQSIAKWFQDAGRATGIVTTTRVTHASPAGAYAHTAEREWEDDSVINNHQQDSELCDDIAEQLVYDEPGKYFNVILGGGRHQFLPKEHGGHRLDKKNLVEEWIRLRNESSYAYVTTRDDLVAIPAVPEYLLGLFGDSHLAYRLENETQPTLSEMTLVAIETLQKSQKGAKEGFFLFVEGGKIDLAHHENMARIALDETLEMDKAIAVARRMTRDKDTLIVVTADHSHTMTINGYPTRNSSILGTAAQADDGVPYSIINYANGPSASKITEGKRPIFNEDDTSDVYFQFPSYIPLALETHGGDDVAVFASGPWAHLFTGSVEQNFIPHAMAYAACVGKGKTMCD